MKNALTKPSIPSLKSTCSGAKDHFAPAMRWASTNMERVSLMKEVP